MIHRSISIIETTKEVHTVIACDVCAAIGQKKYDRLTVDPIIVGRCTARVVLMELISYGAQPHTLVLATGCEYTPTGEAFLKGAKIECDTYKPSSITFISSMETNMLTSETSLAITGIGTISSNSHPRDPHLESAYVYLYGHPYVGQSVLDNYHLIPDYNAIIAMKKQDLAIVPVGSRGLLYDIKRLSHEYKLSFTYHALPQIEPLLSLSAGPATAFMIIANKPLCDTASLQSKKLTYIGQFTKD